MDAFGKDWFDVREGEASVFKPDGNGAYKLVARVQATDWSKLAQHLVELELVLALADRGEHLRGRRAFEPDRRRRPTGISARRNGLAAFSSRIVVGNCRLAAAR